MRFQHTANRRNDADITRAPAEISRQFQAHPIFVRIWQSGHDIISRNQHTRGAVSALQGMVFMKCRPQFTHNRIILEALERVRFVVMSDIDQPIYTYYGDELPQVQAYLERHFAVPSGFPLDDAKCRSR